MAIPHVLLSATPTAGFRTLEEALKDRGLRVSRSAGETELLQAIDASRPPHLVLLAQTARDVTALLDLATRLRRRERRLPIVLLVRDAAATTAIQALRIGIKDFFNAPYPVRDVVEGVVRCLAEGRDPGAGMPAEPGVAPIRAGPRGHSPSLYLDKLAAVDSNVLITGETGTGKEVAADYIHHHGRRRARPLCCVNCAALPDTLLESELFGYAKGAFTGAQTHYPGKLRLAEGGTVFFDEIGDMTPYAQAKILRVIETKQVWPLGGRRCLPLDVRIIAATNRDLEAMIETGEFRLDLYYRLNVGRIHLPPLRERKEEIPRLFARFLREQCAGRGQDPPAMAADATELLLRYDWPGNIRELKNLAEALLIDPPRGPIQARQLPLPPGLPDGEEANPLAERDRLLAALESNAWNKSRTAANLGCSRMTLYRKMKKYAIRQRTGDPY